MQRVHVLLSNTEPFPIIEATILGRSRIPASTSYTEAVAPAEIANHKIASARPRFATPSFSIIQKKVYLLH